MQVDQDLDSSLPLNKSRVPISAERSVAAITLVLRGTQPNWLPIAMGWILLQRGVFLSESAVVEGGGRAQAYVSSGPGSGQRPNL